MDMRRKYNKELMADIDAVRLYIKEKAVKLKTEKTKSGETVTYRIESYMIDPPKEVVEICKKRGWIK